LSLIHQKGYVRHSAVIHHFTAHQNPFGAAEHIQVFIVLGLHNFAFAIEGKAIYLSAKTDY
jgi:hypothetical protein